MVEGLNSPNIHTPKTLSEYGNIMLHNANTSLWAGGTYIMTRPDVYPSRATGTDNIIYLGEIEELHRFQRNDRVAEFGAMVPLYQMATSGKGVLPKILVSNIESIGCSIITRRATIGGALCTPDMTTSIPGTLIALSSNVEMKIVKKKRLHSRWAPISRLVDKNGRFQLPPKALLSRVRIAINQPSYQKFFCTKDFMSKPEDSVAIAFVADWEQDILQNARLVITLPKSGICFSRDIDNIFTALRFPLEDSEYDSIYNVLFAFISSSFQISPLQKAIIRSFVGTVVEELNRKALTMPISEN